MTGRQAIVRLKLALNKLDTASNRTVRPEQALLFLNNAYEELAKAKYQKLNGVIDNSGFQFNQVTTDELNHLTRINEQAPNKEGNEFSVNIEDIENYWIHLRSELQVKAGTITQWIKDPNYKTLDTLGTTLSDPFNNSIPSAPITFFEDNKIKVIGKDFEILKIKTIYYRKPETITLDEEIKAPFTLEIIKAAAVLILENWGDPRSQSKIAVEKVIDNE